MAECLPHSAPYDQLWGHKWGYKDSRFYLNDKGEIAFTGNRYQISGKVMPYFLPFANAQLQTKLVYKEKPSYSTKPVPQATINESFMAALERSYRQDQYTKEDFQRLVHSHGQTTADEIYRVLYDKLDKVCDLVVFPESEADVEKVISLASEHNVCLVPYGGGTSVSNALQLPTREKRMIVVLDMRRMNRIVSIDKVNRTACIEAGITGQAMEEALANEGFTTGHEPDSIELSTLGGWIATNASGMKKNRYGNIEEIVERFTLMTPRGRIESLGETSMPRLSIGMQPHKLLFGHEGTMGVVTKATLRIHKLPEVKRYGSLVFPDMDKGIDFLYDLGQFGFPPASVRLVDNFQFRFGAALKPRMSWWESLVQWLIKFYLFKIRRFDPLKMVAATLVMEGPKAFVNMQWDVLMKLAKRHKGIYGGEGNGKRGYTLTFAIAYIRDFLSDFDIIGETYETTVPWARIRDVIRSVSARADELHKQYGFPGVPFCSARITQIYHSGVCIYFTHGWCCAGVPRADRILIAIENELRKTILANGGSVSHHHGIGKLRKEFMPQAISKPSMDLLRDLKHTHDTQNIFGIRNNVFADDD